MVFGIFVLLLIAFVMGFAVGVIMQEHYERHLTKESAWNSNGGDPLIIEDMRFRGRP